jgi:hypothetical protein
MFLPARGLLPLLLAALGLVVLLSRTANSTPQPMKEALPDSTSRPSEATRGSSRKWAHNEREPLSCTCPFGTGSLHHSPTKSATVVLQQTQRTREWTAVLAGGSRNPWTFAITLAPHSTSSNATPHRHGESCSDYLCTVDRMPRIAQQVTATVEQHQCTSGGELVAVETSALPTEPGERLPVELCVDTRGLASAVLSFVEGRQISERTERGTPLCIAFDAYLQTTRGTLRMDFGTARAQAIDVGTDTMRGGEGGGGQLVIWLQSRVTNNTTEPPIRLSRYALVEVV